MSTFRQEGRETISTWGCVCLVRGAHADHRHSARFFEHRHRAHDVRAHAPADRARCGVPGRRGRTGRTHLSLDRRETDRSCFSRSQADREFAATLQDATKIDYSIGGLALDYPSPIDAHCTSSATVQHIIPMTPPMNVVVQTTSEMRVVGLP